MNEDAHLEAAYEQHTIGIDYGFIDEDGDEVCEECAELIDDCICCSEHGELDCNECEMEE